MAENVLKEVLVKRGCERATKMQVLMKISETSVARNEDEDRAGVAVSTLVHLTGVLDSRVEFACGKSSRRTMEEEWKER